MPKTLTSPEAAALRAQLTEPGRHEGVSARAGELLAQICTGALVPAAVKHPLGFTCVPLYRGPGWGLCMHAWPPLESALTFTAEVVHSHSWDLSSLVFCGQLENVEVRISDGPQCPTQRVLEVTSLGRTDLICSTSRLVGWTAARSTHVGAGECYRLPAGTFHMSRPGAVGPTATVVLAEDRLASPELVLGHLNAHDHMVVRTPCLPGELQQMADLLLRNLNSSPCGAPAARFR